MELQQLYYFKTIAQSGSLARASEILYVTPPSLSKSLSRLEAELAVPLFDRIGNNRIRLNNNGRIFLNGIESGIGAIEETVRILQDLNAPELGSIRYAVSGYDLIESMLEGFIDRHPGIHMFQMFLSSSEMEQALDDGRIDFAVNYIPPSNERFSFTPIIHGRFMALVGKDHPLAKKESIALSELASESFVINNSCIDQPGLIKDLCKQSGFKPDIIFEGDAPHVLRKILETGKAVGLTPSHAEARVQRGQEPRAPFSPDLISIPIHEPDTSYQIGIITLKDHYITRASENFISYLTEEMPKYQKSLQIQPSGRLQNPQLLKSRSKATSQSK